MEDSKSKAEALNQQFVCFSQMKNKCMTNKPELKGNPSPDISHLEISEEGVKKLLSNVNPKMANGPDNTLNRVLKDCATIIAPYVTTIYKKIT